jgi:hypothetical protein
MTTPTLNGSLGLPRQGRHPDFTQELPRKWLPTRGFTRHTSQLTKLDKRFA